MSNFLLASPGKGLTHPCSARGLPAAFGVGVMAQPGGAEGTACRVRHRQYSSLEGSQQQERVEHLRSRLSQLFLADQAGLPAAHQGLKDGSVYFSL